MNLLECEYCKRRIDHAHECAICTECGHICKKIPLIYGDFEAIGEVPTPLEERKEIEEEDTNREVF